jgi:hypothetical protein
VTQTKLAKFGSQRWASIHSKYGLTKADWERMYAEQLGLCAICREREATVVDHCHATKTVRGLLCYSCNMILGVAERDPELVDRMLVYKETAGRTPLYAVQGGKK